MKRGVGVAVGAVVLWAVTSPGPALAQQVTGVLGSPDTTTTLDGKQLPPLPKFGGVIKESDKDSKPSWPPRVVPPRRPTCCSS